VKAKLTGSAQSCAHTALLTPTL